MAGSEAGDPMWLSHGANPGWLLRSTFLSTSYNSLTTYWARVHFPQAAFCEFES